MKKSTGLENEKGQSVALKSVHLDGRLDGLLLTMKVFQKYVNDSKKTIEASYTFPAGWGANLLSFSVALNGKRMQAVALAKDVAEEKYEDAIKKGDTPVMLEKSPLGLYTANLGNLKRGEEAVIEIEYAQLLRFEKGRLRITVPTVIGQRYGDAKTQGHVQAHQGLDTDALVEYPFTAKLDVLGQVAAGVLTCPSHKVAITPFENGQRLELSKGATMDRDFVVAIDELEGASFACAAADGEAFAAIASFCPKLSEQAPKDVALKILVDCSGSMQGESIEQAQEALHELSLALTEKDLISYSKFGSKVIHTSNQLERFGQQYLSDVLAPAILDTEADMGGTELDAALHSTFKLSFAKAFTEGCDLLLITDGDVWEIEDIVRQAKVSQHRIFAIGVGSAPAESLLRDLAEQTGGACELVTPSESIAQAVMRMLQRMRTARTNDLTISWGEEVVWQSSLPKQVFSEETIHVFAQLKSKPSNPPKLQWTEGEASFNASAHAMEWDATSTTARLAAGAKIATPISQKEATELALKYQLASKYTNLLLVHIREDEDKAIGLPTLEKIQQMQAAGWGGFGMTTDSLRYSASISSHMRFGIERVSLSAKSYSNAAPSVWRTNRTQSGANNDLSSQGGVDNFQLPEFLRKPEGDLMTDLQAKFFPFEEDDFTPTDMLEKFNELSVTTSNFGNITWELMGKVSKGYVWEVLCDTAGEDGDVDQYWACLLNWLSGAVPGIVPLARHAKRRISVELAKLDADLQQAAEGKFASVFQGISTSSWGQTKAKEKRSLGRRLKKILTGA